MNSSFTQDFNRYTYARNNPLKYTDPSGHAITGYEIWSFIMFPIFLPARLLSEGFTWIDDKINGNTRYGPYCEIGYLMGQTAPGSLVPYNPVNLIQYGQPGYTPPGALWGNQGSVRFGTGWAMGADGEWNDILDRPIIMKMTKYWLYRAAQALGVDQGKPILEEYRTVAFVNAAKSLWFKFAPSPVAIGLTKLNNAFGAVNGLAENRTNLHVTYWNKNTQKVDSSKFITDMNNVFIKEGIRIVKLIPEWDVIYQRGKIVEKNFIIEFSEKNKKKYKIKQGNEQNNK